MVSLYRKERFIRNCLTNTQFLYALKKITEESLLITQTCLCSKQPFLKTLIKGKIYIFLIFAKNIDCGYMLALPQEVVLRSTHDLCFRAKIRKKCIPLYTPILPYKSGVKGGLHYTEMLA